MTDWRRLLSEHCDGYLAARLLALVAPALLLALAGGGEAALQGGMLAVCCLIAMERGALGWRAGLLQAALALAGCFFMAGLWRWPLAFALGCGAAAEAACRLGARQARWRSAANFTFIPALYLGCEAAQSSEQGMAALLPAVPWLAAGALAACWLHGVAGRRAGMADKPGAAPETGVAFVCVGLLAWLAAHFQLPCGQWLVWSGASVCVGGFAAVRAKCWQRCSGALLGVPAGMLAALALHPTPALLMLLGAATMLTLALFRAYRPAFAARSALAALHLSLVGGMAAVRLIDVGLAAALVLLVWGVGQWLAEEKGEFSRGGR
ncbi:FUSC family protein [Chromobacterium paludis]|uniref:FUSC family protein n=1 Tax=Chromobacterium paludis TaxID=2605945 RepID=A0A5C1DJK8_9NEIS|nr:FUSC family protein [Chromobacterium paludis]QEL56951.1 FUSC family protein [Chromobacterium paludis]